VVKFSSKRSWLRGIYGYHSFKWLVANESCRVRVPVSAFFFALFYTKQRAFHTRAHPHMHAIPLPLTPCKNYRKTATPHVHSDISRAHSSHVCPGFLFNGPLLYCIYFSVFMLFFNTTSLFTTPSPPATSLSPSCVRGLLCSAFLPVQ
jgi:hypothetical protein